MKPQLAGDSGDSHVMIGWRLGWLTIRARCRHATGCEGRPIRESD